jgi:structure-specific recognition protein 1
LFSLIVFSFSLQQPAAAAMDIGGDEEDEEEDEEDDEDYNSAKGSNQSDVEDEGSSESGESEGGGGSDNEEKPKKEKKEKKEKKVKVEKGEKVKKEKKEKKEKSEKPEKSSKKRKEGDEEGGGGGATKTKKKRAKKDKNAPKGALTAFMLYSNSVRSQVKAEHPSMPVTEIAKEIGTKWRALTAEEKEPFEATAREDRERFVCLFLCCFRFLISFSFSSFVILDIKKK